MIGRLTPEQARRLARTLTGLWARPLDASSMRASAIVFSPHQDDETLGCGGTIIKKRELGASVEMVYMTDGTTSPLGMPIHELKALRKREARAACEQLGIEQDKVTFFEFADGQLSEHVAPAIEQVTRFLIDHPAQQILVPYYQDRDPGLDHVATNQIVLAALRQLGSKAIVYEYPVWYWRWWPETRFPIRGQQGGWKPQRHSLLHNLRSLADFGFCVQIDDVLDRKRAALNQHRSQVDQLSRIRSGVFIDWFFHKRELLRKRLP
jgi:LmbE family N-acetylglucosaminyl deacetylase